MARNDGKRSASGTGPVVKQTALDGRLGEQLVGAAVTGMGFLYHDTTGSDFGIDGVIEITTVEDGQRIATGRQIAVQVKTGDSVVKRTRYGYSLYCTSAHAHYWLNHSLPVIIVHCEPATRYLRWAPVNSDALRSTPNGYSIDIAAKRDFNLASADLVRLASPRIPEPAEGSRSFFIVWNERGVIEGSDEQIGLTALEAAEAASRDDPVSIEVEVRGQAELVAMIDAIGDRPSATAKERRDALQFGAKLDGYEQKAKRLQRALRLFLTDSEFTGALGLGDQPVGDDVMAAALRSLAKDLTGVSEGKDGTCIAAWPDAGRYEPKVVFTITEEQHDRLLASDLPHRAWMQMSEGMSIVDLPRMAFHTRYLPALALRLTYYADDHGIADAEALAHIRVPLYFWAMAYD